MTTEYFGTGPKKGRGMAKESAVLMMAMRDIVEECQPITGRGVGYRLFARGLIPSMDRNEMKRVYRLLLIGREQYCIPWEWIVDEGRELEIMPTWADPAQYAKLVGHLYRRDFWAQQPQRVAVWSEKGTVRGLLRPVLDQYAVGFRVMHGFGSATTVHGTSQSNDGKRLVVLYVGDIDPSGLFMSEVDLPKRFTKYDGEHVTLKRIALTKKQVTRLPSFSAFDKQNDSRFDWFISNHGDRCWELDAMDPRALRNLVEGEINSLIDRDLWGQQEAHEAREKTSLEAMLRWWGGIESLRATS